ncbi:hypothetical protein BDV96DRAFT_298624 [Lophiotrema nucula]|uniref:F-box domain-containing protein n=1 Tax=Lophiotrema nucula TaxID=690887 RepID=A0A6A5YKD7_9PLEO|nr:hypothetical protein BDV96DRAFT_298624 [Lophiotrema nucula]
MGASTSRLLGTANKREAGHCSCCHCSQRLVQTSTGRPDLPFRFLDLPLELRYMVYEELLVVGKVFYKCDSKESHSTAGNEGMEFYARPFLSMLCVCKSMHAEAEPIYLARNLFVLPLRWHESEPFSSTMNSGTYDPRARHLMSRNASLHLKHISVALDQSDLTAFEKANHDCWRYNERFFDGMRQDTLLAMLHVNMIADLEDCDDYSGGFSWAHVAKALQGLFAYHGGPNNRHLELCRNRLLKRLLPIRLLSAPRNIELRLDSRVETDKGGHHRLAGG